MARARPQVFIPFEDENYARGFTCVAGIDEVGIGPLAGPVVAAAVVLPRDFKEPGVNDSKLLTETERERLAPVIKANAISWGLGIVDVQEIDRINILKAALLAMAKACRALEPEPDHLLIDGNRTIPVEFFSMTYAPSLRALRQTAIIKGDRVCFSIAAASIIAKVARDHMMIELDASYPQYGFAGHKGYCSAGHLEALRRYGPSQAHRRSFGPVRELCGLLDIVWKE